MKVKQQGVRWAVVLAVLTVLLTGCSGAAPEQVPPAQSASRIASIPFSEGQLYAAVYLGYQEMQDLSNPLLLRWRILPDYPQVFRYGAEALSK